MSGFMGLYILDEHGQPVPVNDPMEWAEWNGRHPEAHRVAMTKIDGVSISTVFLRLDHNFNPMADPLTHKPVLWETMVFGGRMDQFQVRYNSLENAKAGHEEIVKQVQAEQGRLAGMTMAQRAQQRPENFESLSPEEQWEVDKHLGILDWDGEHGVEVSAAKLRLRLLAGRRFRD